MAPATVSGGAITIDTLLQQPLRITREITDYVVLSSYFMDKVFRNVAAPGGGAVVYYPLEGNDLYGDPSRDVQQVDAGSEFPVINSTRKDPQVATVQKYGGKFYVPDEAVRRNDVALVRRQEQQLANKMAQRLEKIGIDQLNTAAAANPYPVPTWKGVNADTTADDLEPFAGFAFLQAAQQNQELGVNLDTLIANPTDLARLRIVYREDLTAMMADVGFTQWFATPKQPAGSALAVAAGEVGFVAWEKAPYTETWRDPAEEVTWVQHGALPAIAIDNPFAVRLLTGIAA
jgi:hypothetical protein